MEQKLGLCAYCKKNHAAKSGDDVKNGKAVVEYYCLDCYARLFLSEERAGGSALNACPYCGMTIEEIRAGKLVGCAHCYTTMSVGVFPIIRKMQKKKVHNGKLPPLDGDYGDPYDFDDSVGEQYRAKAMAQARYDRQCNELEIIIKKLKSEDRLEEAKGYEEKLTAMRNTSAIEEDFVWRTRRKASKQS